MVGGLTIAVPSVWAAATIAQLNKHRHRHSLHRLQMYYT
jgi:hypothetical protein